MDKENWLDALNDDIRDIRKLTLAITRETEIMKEEAKETKRMADAAVKKADAAWEIVLMTRNQIQEELAYLRKPIWKKWFGIN